MGERITTESRAKNNESLREIKKPAAAITPSGFPERDTKTQPQPRGMKDEQ